jgi:hypothetical protein
MQKKTSVKNIYRCGTEGDHPPQTLAATPKEAAKSLGCAGCEALDCKGPVLCEKLKIKPAKATAPAKAPKTVFPELPMTTDIKAFVKGFNEMPVPVSETPFSGLGGNIKAMAEKDEPAAASMKLLDIDEETDAAIRRELEEMASVAAHISQPSNVSEIVTCYGDEIRAAREQNHGWDRIAKIFREHGLHVGKESLKARIEQG